ncbi:XTP/dITP diphosphohydrolase [Candidatus Planktophila dulcis]|jgi:XTP/dITP diphosphohydrolase|uniref:XTP/dITP diphosphohydrolase n=1 Tax=Candidatus Planktophila dulcis TaxID=1884914 RepID=A0AAC9YS09_9ACTN|nr:MazG family protein [Candidatus Planktophila dulcis]ASY11531.1 XTP/dITP diphosphohydrolase [Candidatus Planktophila dulcis]
MADSQLQRLVEVMDRLRSPGGCPWDAEQTHESLIKYLLEESYEFIDAIETDDRAGMREELGDVLLQVYFHSRIAQDHPTDPFSIEDVAGAIADKLISRHPHVFENLEVSGTDEIIENWEAIKAREKGRTSAIDGIAMAQPALPLVAKILYRAEKYNVDLHVDEYSSEKATEKSVGEALASVIAWAHENGIDPENALRAQAREMIRQIQAAEQQGK